MLQMDYDKTYREFVSLLLASKLTTLHSNFFDSNFIRQKLQLHANVSQLAVLLQQQQARLPCGTKFLRFFSRSAKISFRKIKLPQFFFQQKFTPLLNLYTKVLV